ncbi:MAG: DUF6445 family protein [Pseudomonadota bacterium]
MFNPNPRIEIVPIAGRHVCHVVDDALLDPDAVVEYAVAHADAFVEAGHNAYPGPELRMPDVFSAQLDAFFVRHLRSAFGVRRTERMYSRLAITATPPHALSPSQSLCHVDRLSVDPKHRIVASVLYLFRDSRLGGTSFYAPLHPPEVILPMIADSERMTSDAFRERYGVDTGYITASNAWFEKIVTVPARFNRLIFYQGTLFHSGEIAYPELLSRDPRTGRLSLNGFFTCRRSLGA